MLNGRILKPLVLALCVACLGGCDSNAMSAGGSSAQNALPEGHQIVDGGRGRIWTLTHEGLFLRHIASVESRAIELPGWMMAGQPYGHGPALALAPGGDVLVTSD